MIKTLLYKPYETYYAQLKFLPRPNPASTIDDARASQRDFESQYLPTEQINALTEEFNETIAARFDALVASTAYRDNATVENGFGVVDYDPAPGSVVGLDWSLYDPGLNTGVNLDVSLQADGKPKYDMSHVKSFDARLDNGDRFKVRTEGAATTWSYWLNDATAPLQVEFSGDLARMTLHTDDVDRYSGKPAAVPESAQA